jgi:hypothetical protein
MNDEQLESRAAKVEHLLAELQRSAGPTTFPLVEQLMTALLDLYGGGLGRLLDFARRGATSRDQLDGWIAEDEALSSLLLLHDLHPFELAQRVERALERLAAELSTLPARLDVLKLEVPRAVLRVSGASDEVRAHSYAKLAVRAIERAAPELTEITIEGLPERHESLIPADRLVRARA